MKINVIITTKNCKKNNRQELFEKAIESIINQSRKADKVIVVSDSDDNDDSREIEKYVCKKNELTLIYNEYTRNYAGSLNSAIHFIINSELENAIDFENTYIAILDDDDTWDKEYLKKCENAIKKNEDFVICGIVRVDDNRKRNLSISKSVKIDNFLESNPNIQGSNTFIKLETLLKAGEFDENMPSTADRDLFVRVMMLSPSYVILNEYLVYIDASDKRKRITNSQEDKKEGLQKFYYKYHGFMSKNTEHKFFEKAKERFNIEKHEIENYSFPFPNIKEPNLSSKKYNGKLIIGFISTEYKLGLRLLRQLISVTDSYKTKIIILINFTQDTKEYENILSKSKFNYKMLYKNEIKKEEIENILPPEYIKSFEEPVIKDIAVSRSILQYYLYKLSEDENPIWILDEDMKLMPPPLNPQKLFKTSLKNII